MDTDKHVKFFLILSPIIGLESATVSCICLIPCYLVTVTVQIFYKPVIPLTGSLYYLTLTSNMNKEKFRTSKEGVAPFEM